MLARAQLAVVMILRRLRRDGGTRRCISYGAAGRGIASNAASRAMTSARGGVPLRPTRCTRHIVCFAKISSTLSSPRGRFEHRFPDMHPRFRRLDRLRKSHFGSPAKRTAPALPHSMTRSAPRRASVQSFANCDGGGYDRLRPVSRERQPPRIEQRTSAHASEATSEASQPMMNCGHRPKRTAGGSCTS